MDKECLIPDCHKKTHSRGLCSTCIRAAQDQVARRVVTWDQLIEWKLALPKVKAGRPGGLFTQILRRHLAEIEVNREGSHLHNS